jgi:TldD protein
VKDTWQTPAAKDPFRVPLSRKLEILFDVNEKARKGSAPVVAVQAQMQAVSEEKLFVSSEGAEIDQTVMRVSPGYSVTVAANGDFESRDHGAQAMGLGFEYVESAGLSEEAARVADEAHQKLLAPPVEPGEKDLVLLPSHLWLTIHESIGHSTELDRAFGYEANFAGTSFATFPQTGTLRYAGDHVTFYGDRTTPGALATCGWDDDGVPTERWDIVRNGVLVDWQTTREQAAWIGAAKGHACSYADSWGSMPFQRMPNVSLAPAKDPVTLEQLIGGVQDGVLLDGASSYSIDQQRLNFQFSGDMAWEIKGGQRGKPVRHAAYQSTTTTFWNALDALGGPATWAMGGSMYDGKGEPMQVNPVSHGCPVSRFRRIRVLDSRGQS